MEQETTPEKQEKTTENQEKTTEAQEKTPAAPDATTKAQDATFHGSDIELVAERAGIRREMLTNFASNVNPLGISSKLRISLGQHVTAISDYPDRAYKKLTAAIAEYVVLGEEDIMVGNGVTELLRLFLRAYRPKHALIVTPTYSEYSRQVIAVGGEVKTCPLREEDDFAINVRKLISRITPQTDLLILCNPNNPTSSEVDRSDLRTIVSYCAQNGTFVLIDETYIEFSEACDAITGMPIVQLAQNLMVLRGISKFFAAPGLRLGYAACENEELKEKMRREADAWSVNTLAAVACQDMFKDWEYIKRTKKYMREERERICEELDLYDEKVRYYPPHANFILLRTLEKDTTSADLFSRALKRRMVIRDCSSFPDLGEEYVRFCLLKPDQNDRLIRALFDTPEGPDLRVV